MRFRNDDYQIIKIAPDGLHEPLARTVSGSREHGHMRPFLLLNQAPGFSRIYSLLIVQRKCWLGDGCCGSCTRDSNMLSGKILYCDSPRILTLTLYRRFENLGSVASSCWKLVEMKYTEFLKFIIFWGKS